MNRSQVFYLCNRKKCPNCHEECRHTSDLRFAKYQTDHRRFEEVADKMIFEQEPGEEDDR